MTEQALPCCIEIYIKINTYWLAIKFIPLSPELFSLFLLPFIIPNDCLSAQWGIFWSLEISSLLGLHQLHRSSWTPPVIQISQEMSDSILNPNLLTGSGWKKRKADEKGNLSEGCLWSRESWHGSRGWFVCVFSQRLVEWLWHWAFSLWPSVVSLHVRSPTIFPLWQWY